MKKLLLILLAVLTPGFGQTGTTPKQNQFNYVVQTLPGPIPNSAMTAVMKTCSGGALPGTGCLPAGHDAYVCYVDLSGSTQTVTIQDNQATPVIFVAALLATGVPYKYESTQSNCRWMPGGPSWQASATGAVGYMIIKYN
jgi:hypothetical protein